MRVTVISAAGIVGAFIFQGCKTEAGTRVLETEDKIIKNIEDLIKTDHSVQQCVSLTVECEVKIDEILDAERGVLPWRFSHLHATDGKAYQNQQTKINEKIL